MRRLLITLLPGLAVAFAAVALSAPVSAGDTGRIVFVQGRPGVRVDVCVGGREIVSALPYGHAAARVVAIGARRFTFLRAADGRCQGERIVGWYRMVAPGSDTTVALARETPRVVVFADDHDYAPDPGSSRLVMRNASDLGMVTFRYTLDPGTVWHPTPTVIDDGFEKGAWGGANWTPGLEPIWWVERSSDGTALGSALTLMTKADTRHEVVLVGTTPRNARLVRVDTSV